MTKIARHIEDLADELISDILFFLLPSDNLSATSSPVNFLDLSPGLNGRPAHVYGEQTELDRFRLVCKRFLRISTPKKFTRFHLRFSRRGFRRLEELMHWQLACHVKHFTYLVRPFYQESGWSQFLAELDSSDFPIVGTHRTRLQDQMLILDSNHDGELLKKAMAAFSSLRQVKLLRLQDQAHERLLDYLCERSLEGSLSLNWEPACTRAMTNLGTSLLASSRTSVGFIGPQIDPRATIKLLQTPSTTLFAIGARLTSLEITFYANLSLTSYIGELSQVFHDFFLAAKNLEIIHLGFATTVPVDLSLEQVFHRIQWKRLRKLSIQWLMVTSPEIISLIRRHRRQLRDIRLVNIFLHNEGRWRDVLSVLHDEMDAIEHIDLRGINYASYIDGVAGNNGPGSSYAMGHNDSNGSGNSLQHQAPLNTDYLAFALSGLPRHMLSTPIPEGIRNLSVNDLGDDGTYVTYAQRQLWEAWVLSSPRWSARRRN
ncbi:hypothetical protein BDV18DRAFT_29295 [Aspergillus unguis]